MPERLQRCPNTFPLETADRIGGGHNMQLAWLDRTIFRHPARRSRAAPDLPPEGALSGFRNSPDIGRLINIARRSTNATAPSRSASALTGCKP